MLIAIFRLVLKILSVDHKIAHGRRYRQGRDLARKATRRRIRRLPRLLFAGSGALNKDRERSFFLKETVLRHCTD